ncbi:Lrp/AsnC family transcriptional regulator [Jatrophihabitans telluris]|uniref:Lrp/AsnC family transcriptional regulator n=1 Tax=Jatrophihabitans telluris TaxID=2038343 RepID=A0ABY4QVZ0_9ACTN|nr:Lrp/AsnC family transcriptional regulator [Jatrophihabitans telluris]UQX87508.1 Lrp/AsnC family transcriptional regulator [Jatrophihabitans telluris]
MPGSTSSKSSTIDRVDRQIIHCLQLSPRAGFSRIAAAVDVSEQTVARRYRRLVSEGVIRVIAAAGPNRATNAWTLRIQCRPNAGAPMAEALAAMDDVSWVTLVAAGSEIVCAVRSRNRADSDELLLRRIPRTAEVLNFSAHALLHPFRAGRADDWAGYEDTLDRQRQDAYLVDSDLVGFVPGTSYRREAIDAQLLDTLSSDGRAPIGELARIGECSQGRIARRIEYLQRAGELRFEVEISGAALGFGTTAYLWLVVEPAQLAAAGAAIADHVEVSFVAAVTGAANLMVSVLCHDSEELYAYVTNRIGAIAGVRQAEISVALRRVKYERSRVTNERVRSSARAVNRLA